MVDIFKKQMNEALKKNSCKQELAALSEQLEEMMRE